MPRSKTGAGPGRNGAFVTSKKTARPGQNLVLNIDWTGAKFSSKYRLDRGKSLAQNNAKN